MEGDNNFLRDQELRGICRDNLYALGDHEPNTIFLGDDVAVDDLDDGSFGLHAREKRTRARHQFVPPDTVSHEDILLFADLKDADDLDE